MFLARSVAAENLPIEGFSTAAMEAICRAAWPGNVRQLQNAIQRAVILADGTLIRPQDLHGLDPAPTGSPAPAARNGATNGGTNGTANGVGGGAGNGAARPPGAAESAQRPQMDATAQHPFLTEDGHIRRLLDIEADAIAQALSLYRGRMAETARRLGIGRSTLYRKIDERQLGKQGL